jgi:hypothetical protein
MRDGSSHAFELYGGIFKQHSFIIIRHLFTRWYWSRRYFRHFRWRRSFNFNVSSLPSHVHQTLTAFVTHQKRIQLQWNITMSFTPPILIDLSSTLECLLWWYKWNEEQPERLSPKVRECTRTEVPNMNRLRVQMLFDNCCWHLYF